MFSLGVHSDTDNLQGCWIKDRTILISLFYFHPLTNISTFNSSYASDISNSYFNTSKRDYQAVFQWNNPHLRKKVFD